MRTRLHKGGGLLKVCWKMVIFRRHLAPETRVPLSTN